MLMVALMVAGGKLSRGNGARLPLHRCLRIDALRTPSASLSLEGKATMKLHIGTSGWMYDDWRGRFYPPHVPKTRWFSHYSQHFSTVELNSSFYHLPSEKAFNTWREKAPDGFVYALKVSRYITHLKKLRDVEEPVQTFVTRARLLGNRLGPLLYQLPPGLKRNDALLEAFLELLPWRPAARLRVPKRVLVRR